MKEESRNNRLVLISLFLTLEIMLFIAFDFGGIGLLFKGIAFVLMLILLPHFWKGMQDDLMKGLYILLMPLVFYLFITLLAPAYGTMDVVYNNETFMNFSLFTKLINLVGITAVLILGYMVNKSNLFSAKSVYIVVLAGLAAPIFISFLATLINYGPFHTIIYAGKVIFYNGDVYLVATQASYLVGFSIIPANINVLINGAIILSSVGFGLLFLKGKQEKYETITLAVVSAIGLLTIVMLGAFRQLIYLIPAALFVLVMKFGLMKYLKNKVTLGILLGVVSFGAIVFILTAFNVFNLQTIWQSNPITRRLLLNGYMTKFYFIFKEAISFKNLYGDFRNSIGTIDIFPTGNFLFDSLWIDGLLGFLGLAIFLTLFVNNLIRYFASSRDSQLLKVSLVTLLLTMFFRFMLKYPFHRFIYEEHLSFDFWPLINSPFFLITVFFAGYVFTASQSDGGKIDEKNNIGFLFAALFSITGCSAVRETFDQDQFHTNDFKLNYYHGTPSKYLVADNYRETIINATGRVTFNSPFDNAYNAIILSDVLNGDIPSIDEAIALYGDDKVKAIKLEDYASEVEYVFAINESLARPDNLKASYFHYAELNSMTTGANFSETIKNAFKQGIFSKLTDTLIVCDGSGSLVRIQIDETGMGQTFSHELIDYRNFVISARGGTSIDYGKEGIPSVRSANVRMKISFFIEKSTTSEALKYTLIYDVPEMSSDNNSLTTVMTMDLTSLLPAEALKRVNGMTINYELLDHDYLMPGGVKNDTTDYEFALMLYEVMFPYSVWR